MNLSINEEYFGKLLPYVRDGQITDIVWNGRRLWVDHLSKGRYPVEETLDDRFISQFSTRIANLANVNFNPSEPLLEAETEALRISVIEPSVTNTNYSLAIRKTPAVRRLEDGAMVETGYADEKMIGFMKAAVLARSSVIVCGDVGSGKTELVKYLTKFIPANQRTISIEDNFELRLAQINPDLDCVEIKASRIFSYAQAIKAALRQLCTWLLLSEARSREVAQLLEAASTGCSVITTIHSDDVRKLPDRVMNMIGSGGAEKKNDIYNFFDVGMKVEVDKTGGMIRRRVSQVCIFDHTDRENRIVMVYDNGFTGEELPENFLKKMRDHHVEDPFGGGSSGASDQKGGCV